MKRYTILAVTLLVTIAGLSWPAIASHEPGEKRLRGEPFSDPTKAVSMPEEWQKQQLQYESWAEGADLAVTLDQHLYPIMLPFVQRYAKEKGVDIAVKEGTCGISAGMLSKKTVDMAGFCCPPGESDRLPGLSYHTVGIAPLAVIVHPENPTDDLTEQQVRDMFRGEILNWSQVGDKVSTFKQSVRPVARLHCKARPGHWRLILDNEDLFSPDLNEVGSIPDMLITVSSIKSAIGHVATWNIHKYGDRWHVKPLKVNGISPFDRTALETGRYPFYRAYNITTWEAPETKKQLAQDLLYYLQKHTEELDERFGMVSVERLRKAGWRFNGDELTGEPE